MCVCYTSYTWTVSSSLCCVVLLLRHCKCWICELNVMWRINCVLLYYYSSYYNIAISLKRDTLSGWRMFHPVVSRSAAVLQRQYDRDLRLDNIWSHINNAPKRETHKIQKKTYQQEWSILAFCKICTLSVFYYYFAFLLQSHNIIIIEKKQDALKQGKI